MPFHDLGEQVKTARRARLNMRRDKLISFGLPMLDDACVGMGPGDLVVVGADTGIGKTNLALHTAWTNAMAGKRVALFCLEGDPHEVGLRWEYRLLRQAYDALRQKPLPYPTFQAFRMGLLPYAEELLQECSRDTAAIMDRVQIFDRSFELTADKLLKVMPKIADVDLLIIDHLHYFDLYADPRIPEAALIATTMRTLKTITEQYRMPLYLCAHLRKSERNRGLPEVEDLMGSSHISKVATNVILLCPYHPLDQGACKATLLSIPKARYAEGTRGLVGQVFFDLRRNTYLDGYSLGRWRQGQWEELPMEDYPYWAHDRRNAR